MKAVQKLQTTGLPAQMSAAGRNVDGKNISARRAYPH
jgi:hypothetical protein